MKRISDIDPVLLAKIKQGTVILAQVLALDENRKFAPRYQRALCRYFIDAGVGGIAVGVHSTQFAIRDPQIGLFEPVLKDTGKFIDEYCAQTGKKIIKVGGVCGRTEQAVREAEFEGSCGYDAVLLSMAAFKNDSIESMISHGLFSIPAVKGVEFGAGFSIADMKGSEANDSFVANNGAVETATNNNGGINGGITNGMPIIFRTAIKPTPTIGKEQNTIDIRDNSNVVLEAKGRHDPCIVHRARVVVDSIVAITLCDMLSARFGTDWMAL